MRTALKSFGRFVPVDIVRHLLRNNKVFPPLLFSPLPSPLFPVSYTQCSRAGSHRINDTKRVDGDVQRHQEFHHKGRRDDAQSADCPLVRLPQLHVLCHQYIPSHPASLLTSLLLTLLFSGHKRDGG